MVIFRVIEKTYGPNGDDVGSYGLGLSNGGCHSYFATKGETVKLFVKLVTNLPTKIILRLKKLSLAIRPILLIC